MSIHFYARKGNLDEVSLLIRSGIDVNIRERYTRNTPLLCAALSPEAGVNMLRLLVEQGANVNALSREGDKTVLSHAISSGGVDKVSYLLSQGCDLHYQSKGGYDALIEAAYCQNSKENLVPLLNFLLGRGVSVNGRSDYGESAVTVSILSGPL